ncbi:MAG TPA: acyl-CoA dehydrogenase family protein [Dehalococcoidia bacterium]|nr:acyl-CoA dehydrogenase family protein [Dehalococcoidia bacterium]
MSYGPVRYEDFESAIGLNWYLVDPNLRFLMDRHLPQERREWAEVHLVRWGELVGGTIARRSETVDKSPPRLERYDPWGREVCQVVHHPDGLANKRDVWEQGPHALQARGEEVPSVLGAAFTYMLSQADTGLVCATGMTGGVADLVSRYAPAEVKARFLPRLLAPSFDQGWDGAMFMTELEGGSDLSRTATTARQVDGDRWLLNGSKWFCSNVDARAIVTLARPEGAPEGLKGIALFLVPALRADGSRNGIVIKRIKDKLGTRSVPTAEVDFVDAEAYILSSPRADSSEARGLNRMMSMVNGSRLGVANMALGIMRRSFLEAAIYAAHRRAFGRLLHDLPLVRETLVEMALEVEAAAALVFETYAHSGRRGDEDSRRLYRILVPLSKFRAARRGLELASQGLEIMGGNGYIENFPMARQLRDAQCHTIWEGTENIIALDVWRAIAREGAHEALFARLETALERADHSLLQRPRQVAAGALAQAREAIAFLSGADEELRQLHARRLASLLADVAQASLLLEEAAAELQGPGSARKAAVAGLFVRRRLQSAPLGGIDDDRTVLRLFPAVVRYEGLEPSALASA